jgi:hypothetical protein
VTPVVGRRTPTGDISNRASELNRLDLPLPVAPASATTVWSPDSASRVPARSTRVCAGTSRSSGSWPSTAVMNRLIAVSRSTSRSGSIRWSVRNASRTLPRMSVIGSPPAR